MIRLELGTVLDSEARGLKAEDRPTFNTNQCACPERHLPWASLGVKFSPFISRIHIFSDLRVVIFVESVKIPQSGGRVEASCE